MSKKANDKKIFAFIQMRSAVNRYAIVNYRPYGKYGVKGLLR
jgi:hypothetical protein